MKINMSAPDITEAEITAVSDVLRTRHLSIGPQIERFEQAVAAYVGSRWAVGVNSGTSGLHECIIGAGVTAGDMVLTSPFSFIASANCVLYERAMPIFVDVEEQSGNIDPFLLAEAVEDLCSGGRRAQSWLPRSFDGIAATGELKAVLPIHAYGQPADMDPIVAAARSRSLVVIEDACEAIGAEYKGRKAGTLGDCGVFAFYPNKQITTGEGGMIVTDYGDSADLYRSLRNQGRDNFDAWLSHTRLGFNYRLDELSAALGLAQMARIDELLAKREQVATWYNERLGAIELVKRPQLAANTTRMSWFVYVVRLEAPADRDEVMRALDEVGVPSRAYFNPIHLQPFYRRQFGYQPGDFPVTERLGACSLALPFSGTMTEAEVDCVCDRLNKVLSNIRRPQTVLAGADTWLTKVDNSDVVV